MRQISFALCLVVASLTGQSQELASIKPSPPAAPNPFGFPARSEIRVLPGGAVQATRATLVDLVRRAFDLQPFQVEGGPDWVRTAPYDVVARGDLKQILTERFSLRTRIESRDGDIYRLVMVRDDRRLGPALRSVSRECGGADDCRVTYDASVQRGTMTVKLAGQTMGELARLLIGPETRRLVVDDTGMTGRFEGALAYAPAPLPGLPPMPVNDNAVTLFTALQEQFGLKLEPARGGVDVVVIESAERPMEN
jgi:bla regulator protein blaR1